VAERDTIILRESRARSALKGISWRLVATTTTVVLAGAFIHDWQKAFAIGGTEFIIKFGLYYGHERLWQLAPPGSVVRSLGHRRTDLAAPVYRESRLRSVLKAISWRMIATGTTMAITWGATGDLSAAAWVGSTEATSKLVLYYLHERAWQLVPRGTVRQLLGQGDAGGPEISRSETESS